MLALNILPIATQCNSRLRSLLLLTIVGTLALSVSIRADVRPSKPPSHPAASDSASSSHYLQITINPSTASIIEGAVYGLDADIENISNQPVTVELDRTKLAVQPELAPPEVSCTWFYDAVTNGTVPNLLVMQPGDHFTVFFDAGMRATEDDLLKLPECKATPWSRLRRRLDFVPGNYNFVLSGTLTVAAQPPNADAPGTLPRSSGSSSDVAETPEGHYFTETASLPVTIDQSQIIVYAGLGGLIAFLVMSFRNAATLSEHAGKVQAASRKPFSKIVIILREAGAAILVSVTVTVIASRLSTATFPVRVSVDDFWGALTVGFVSYFVGGKFIDKLAETLGTDPGPVAGAPSSPPGPPTTPTDPRGAGAATTPPAVPVGPATAPPQAGAAPTTAVVRGESGLADS
jgi:hypothetical protein